MFSFLPVLVAVFALFASEASKAPRSPEQPAGPIAMHTASTASPAIVEATLPSPTISLDTDGLGAVAATPLPTSDELKVARYIELASERLDDRMVTALDEIAGLDRKLLALKYYQRRKGDIGSVWAWDEEKVAAHKRSKEYRLAIGEIAAINKAFAEQNPGYRLKVNTEVRTLETQIEIWNEFGSIERASEDLLTIARKTMKDPARWPDEPGPKDLARFTQLIQRTGVSELPTAAVPGFSLHGRGRAFDFVILKDDEIVAGTVASTARVVWDKNGWTEKLNTAVTSVSKRFRGPLRAPYEPWHYDYRP